MMPSLHIQPSGKAESIGMLLRGHDTQRAVVERMMNAAQSWLQHHAVQKPVARGVTRLSSEEHAALKASMLAAVANEVEHQPDLDRAIAYLQALGELAQAEDEAEENDAAQAV